MDRALALPRPTGFTLLEPASRPQLDAARILTLSGSIALNLLAIGLLMMPIALPPLAVVAEQPRLPSYRQIIREPEVVPVVPVARPAPTTAARQASPPRTTQAPDQRAAPAVVSDGGTEFVIEPGTSDGAGSATGIAPEATAPAPIQLEYRHAPAPAYPRRALQQRLAGTVLLRVLVGTDGYPLEVTVARSSGHRELDDAARVQVLKRWSFRPASGNGQPAQAIGLVPIEFALTR